MAQTKNADKTRASTRGASAKGRAVAKRKSVNYAESSSDDDFEDEFDESDLAGIFSSKGGDTRATTRTQRNKTQSSSSGAAGVSSSKAAYLNGEPEEEKVSS